MQIKHLKKLPIQAQNLFNSVYESVREMGKSETVAAKTALQTLKTSFKPIIQTKSVELKQSYISNESDNYIDVLLGYPTLDTHGEYYTPEFWSNSPMKPLIGDMEHINIRKAAGLQVDYPEEWEGFTPIAERYYHKGNELWAKVELPSNHSFTPIFKKMWESGELGASIETAIPAESIEYKWYENKLVPHITTGEITGFTFTRDPAIKTKKNE